LARYGCDVAVIWPLLTRSGPADTTTLAGIKSAGDPTTVVLIPYVCALPNASRHYPPPVDVVLVVVGAAVLVVVVVVLEVVLVVVVVVQ